MRLILEWISELTSSCMWRTSVSCLFQRYTDPGSHGYNISEISMPNKITTEEDLKICNFLLWKYGTTSRLRRSTGLDRLSCLFPNFQVLPYSILRKPFKAVAMLYSNFHHHLEGHSSWQTNSHHSASEDRLNLCVAFSFSWLLSDRIASCKRLSLPVFQMLVVGCEAAAGLWSLESISWRIDHPTTLSYRRQVKNWYIWMNANLGQSWCVLLLLQL